MKNISFRHLLVIVMLISLCLSTIVFGKETTQTYETLDRGVVAVRINPDTVLVSWRYLSSDVSRIAFNVYRDGCQVNSEPVQISTQFYDRNTSNKATVYEVRPVVRKKELTNGCGSYCLPSNAPSGYINIPLLKPEAQMCPDGRICNYSANDASVADLDGDGRLEIILKWDPSNSKDNSHNGYTGTAFLDAYKIDGTFMWRINLGRNIRAGAHYTQFMVYDLNGDGKAEIVAKTSDATIDGCGQFVGDSLADHRMKYQKNKNNRYGYIAYGPEYLTVFNGQTGAAMSTVDYIPSRGIMRRWGDNYGNRSERYLAAVAYLGGKHPSVVMCRGYYTRSVLAAYDLDGDVLKPRWVFDTDSLEWRSYAGQGNHNLRVADVDNDGFDEIIYGSCAIDHDGKGLYNTGLGHGDAIHLTSFSLDSKGLQVWDCHENRRDGSTFRDAATGEIIFQIPSNIDVGRCMASDIDPVNVGLEMWSSDSRGIRNIKGETIAERPKALPVNMAVWWDGDLLREMLDKECISKYDWLKKECNIITRFEGCSFNNGTKSNPCLQGDILGDWREEVIVRTEDSSFLRIYISPHPTKYRFHTFLEDRTYRFSISTQNVAYNQPTQPGFYFGADLEGSGITFRGYKFKK